MSKLTSFNHEQFGELQICTINGKEYFGATNTAVMLGYANPHDAIGRHCKKNGVVKHEVIDNMGRKQEINLISEGNLYRLIAKSKLPSAEQFESWVFDEVLPSIRKHGVYMTEEVIEKTLNDPDFIIKLATQLKEEKQKRLLAEKQIEDQRPKVEMYDELINQKDLLNFKQVASTFGFCGRNSLMKILREENILSDNGFNWNLPYAQYEKYFKVKIVPRRTSDGVKSICTPLCTINAIPFIRKVLAKRKSLQLELQTF